MRDHYDFSRMKGRRNPYIKLLKQSVTIRLDRQTVQYFKDLADSTDLPDQAMAGDSPAHCADQEQLLCR